MQEMIIKVRHNLTSLLSKHSRTKFACKAKASNKVKFEVDSEENEYSKNQKQLFLI